MISKHADMRRKWLRKRGESEVELGIADDLEVIGDVSESVAQSILVQSALKSLTPMQRAVLVLHYEYGLAIREVAHALEIPPGTVASHLARGRVAAAAYIELMPSLLVTARKELDSTDSLHEIEDAEVIEE